MTIVIISLFVCRTLIFSLSLSFHFSLIFLNESLPRSTKNEKPCLRRIQRDLQPRPDRQLILNRRILTPHNPHITLTWSTSVVPAGSEGIFSSACSAPPTTTNADDSLGHATLLVSSST